MMVTHKYLKILALMALCCAPSCVYPFEVDAPQTQKRLVIEGNILIGALTEVNISYMMGLNTPDSEMKNDKPAGKAWVESEDGKRYEAMEGNGSSCIVIDTRTAPAKGRYRLCVEDLGTSREYVTSWQEVNPPAEIDDLTYVWDENTMTLCLSAHSEEGSYFRWAYVEDYKFHADRPKDFIFDYAENKEVKLEESDYSTYWCWSTNSSKEVDLVATTDLEDNRLVAHKFHTFSRSSLRLQTRYRMTIYLSCISSDAYRYLDNLKITSDFTGDLFTPLPSDVNGNISCLEDPKEKVIGYVDVCQISTKEFYLDEKAYQLYSPGRSKPTSFIPIVEWNKNGVNPYPLDLRDFWDKGFAPVYEGADGEGNSGVVWDYKRCTDCRLNGGVLESPEGWRD
ncbi:MAG: DUF4249 domain-containing protein [Candidatus Cryptobacteroides sp.]